MSNFEIEVAALQKVVPIFNKYINGKCYDSEDKEIAYDVNMFNVEKKKLVDEFVMKELRYQRDKKISESDWRMTIDYAGTDQGAWMTFRQELRDLPQKVESGAIPKPTLTLEDEFVFPHWPTPPAS